MAPHSPFDLSRRAALAGGLALALGTRARAARPLQVFAAASLKPPLDQIVAEWRGADAVAVSYGGSGTLARQVARGAPADIVVLAASDWMDWLVGQGVVEGGARVVASNTLTLVGPQGAGPLSLDRNAVLDRLGPDGRIAMGDPMSSPAGRYAQQALETLGLWADLRPRAILSENVRAALAYVARGDVAMGLIYASDTVGTGVAALADIPDTAHQPIIYPGAVLRGAADGAGALLDHIAAAAPVFAAHGFRPVGQS